MKQKIVYPLLNGIAWILIKILHWLSRMEMKQWNDENCKGGWLTPIVQFLDLQISAIKWYVTTEERRKQLYMDASYVAERTSTFPLDEGELD